MNDLLDLVEDENEEQSLHADASTGWKFMIVDDDRDIHRITKIVLQGQKFEGHRLSFLHAYSGAEAKRLLKEHPDTAVVLLDVVMETEDAGLQVVRYVREALNNSLLRIILRTGQPGQAPESSVIRDFDINDYKEKTELTRQKLFTSVHTSIRTYQILRSLADANERLETKVLERTKELEQRGTQLQDSMRLTYEALAEISVLEERSRITRNIHNAVGHTLTTAIVQLEAGKRLLGIDASKAMDKLEMSQMLVRKGLDDIRRSVHGLAAETESVDLIAQLMQLLEETISHTGIQIHYEWEEMPELTFFQKKLVLHALQEGLTNGMRHGGSDRFSFKLQVSHGELNFKLSNNGTVADNVRFGFGLKAIREQVEQLQGSMSLNADGSGDMMLQISFPLTTYPTGRGES
ncbi:histidine kinase [Paenibacillus sp. GCM10027628]|uniref:ATP-binding response regulator n=1 Tax=Paenibacillus sp. GCM10027628 TaxID=3273413 RepID=UPI003644BEEC